MNKEKINIGLDIGIASVGWSILDKNNKIIKHGVRLFPTVDDPKDSKLKNEKRREMRSFRRQTRRRQTRKRDFILFLIEKSFIKLDFKYEINPKTKRPIIKNKELLKAFENKYKKIFSKFRIHQLREKGLSKNLSFEEQLFTLYWYLTRRGFSYQTNDDKKEIEKIKKEFGINLKDELPIHAEQQVFKNKGYINGEFRRLFSRKQWNNEINIFLKKQKIDSKIKDKFLDLFNRQRSFELGPGMDDTRKTQETNPTKWGRFNNETGKYYKTMWENSVGKCSVFKDEYRGPKNSLTAEIFNLLNDLNNISTLQATEKYKLDIDQKMEIVKLAFENKTYKSYLGKLKKWFANNQLPEIEDWSGFRPNNKGNKIITELSSLHDFNKQFKDFELTVSFDDIFKKNQYIEENIVNKYVDICSKTKNPDKRKEHFINEIIKDKKNVNNFDRFIDAIVENSKGYTSNHSLSYKAMHKMIPHLIESDKNQMQILHETNYFDQKRSSFSKNSKYISKKWVNDEILSPTVKRSIIQTINVVNAIIKNYSNDYDINNIVIEMARENNNKQAKEKIKSIQKSMKKRKDKFTDWIIMYKKQGIDIEKGKNLNKLLLYEEQKGLDAYTGKKINRDKMFIDFNYCDIDHIIPYSISFDNSLSNKVLTLSTTNSKKGKNTPFGYLKKDEFIKMKSLWSKWYLDNEDKNIKRYQKSKYQKLIDENDYVNNPELAFRFIARNIVDTRYSTRVILNKFNEFFKDSNTKIKVINGRFTSFIRRYIDTKNNPLSRPTINGINLLNEEKWNEKDYKKDRVWYGHHAEDATIVVVASLLNSKVRSMIEKKLSDPFADKYDGKFSKHQKSEALLNTYSPKKAIWLGDLRKELNSKMNNMQFSYMIQKPKTTQLFNETLYGYVQHIEKDKTIWKKKSPIELFDQTSEQLKKLFPEDINESPLLIAHQRYRDQNLYNELRQIYLNHQGEAKPFKDAVGNNKYIEAKNQKIKKLYKLSSFTPDNSIFINTNKKQSGFYESMEWVAIDIYENNEGKKVIIPVNAVNHTFYNNDKKPLPKKEILDKQLKEKNVNNSIGKLHRLYKGSLLQLESGDIVRIVGCNPKQSTIEVKYVNAITEKIRSRWFTTLNTQLVNSKILHTDPLGNIKKIENF